ncbi:MAG: SHOCT domain-containing protein [Candidatus Bathyarchaeia archaeon]
MDEKEIGKILLIAIVVIIVIVAIGAFFSMMGGYGWSGMMGPGMMGWSWMPFGWISMLIGTIVALLFIWLIIYGLYYILSGRGRAPEPEKRSSLDILKERCAKGEITEEEFKRMKKNLVE